MDISGDNALTAVSIVALKNLTFQTGIFAIKYISYDDINKILLLLGIGLIQPSSV